MLMEVDGHYVAPVVVDHIEIHSGQRYSVLIRTKSLAELQATSGSGSDGVKLQYFIQMETRSRPTVRRSYAILAYELPGAEPPDTFTAPLSPPLTLPPETFSEGWLEDQLHPLPSRPFDEAGPPLAEEVTRRIVIKVQMRNVNNGSLIYVQSGFPWFEMTPVVSDRVHYLISFPRVVD